MIFQSLISSFLHPPVLFFFLGMLAVWVKSDLIIPPQITKFLSLYLLFDIGIKGGEELYTSGFSFEILNVMVVCVGFSFLMPFLIYKILQMKLNAYDAGAISATYGSVSAVTFATSISFLETKEVPFGGYMVAGMALMESPAIIAGLILITLNTPNDGNSEIASKHVGGFAGVLRESFFNGSVFLLVGSMVIGYVCGNTGKAELAPFVSDIFKGMLSLYMLDMGLVAAKRIGDLRNYGFFLIAFALIYPMVGAFLGLSAAYFLGLSAGNALLLTVLVASASYIAVPAAMRLTVPEANMGLLVPMSLGITFSFNISIGIPMYYEVIKNLGFPL